MPNVFEVGRLLVWSSTKPLALQRESVVEVRVSNAPWFRTWNNHVLVAELKLSEGTACHLLRASYATAPGNTFSEVVSVPIRGSGRYQIGGTPLGLDKEGVLRVSADCDGAVIEAMQVYAALGAIDYRARFLHEAPPLPIER
jgi:hypothetical protein